MSDITYKLIINGKKKRIEIFADQDKYLKAFKVIGCRRSNFFDGWTLPAEQEQSLIDVISKLGGDPTTQRTIIDTKNDPSSSETLPKRKYNKKDKTESEKEDVKDEPVVESKSESVKPQVESVSKKSTITSFMTSSNVKKNSKYVSDSESSSSSESEVAMPSPSPSPSSSSSESEQPSEHTPPSEYFKSSSESESEKSPDTPPPKKKFTPPRYKETKERKDSRDVRESRDSRDSRDTRDSRDVRDARDKRGKEKNNYTIKYNQDKIRYYQTLGKKHVVDRIEDSSTEYESSSDDFPTPPKKKYDTEKESLQRRIQELERMIKRK